MELGSPLTTVAFAAVGWGSPLLALVAYNGLPFTTPFSCVWVLFSFEIISDFGTVVFLFLFDKYYLIMD